MSSNNPADLLKQADEAIARNDSAGALRIYRGFLSKHKAHPRVLRVRARAVALHTRMGEYEKAVEIGERAGSRLDEDIDLLYAIGQAYMYWGRQEEAQRTLERCLAIDPDHAPSLARMAVLMMSRKEHDRAVDLVEGAWGRGVIGWDLDHVFAQLAPRAGRVGESIDRLRKWVDDPSLTDTQRSGVAMALATLLEKEGDYAGSWAFAQRANRLARIGWDARAHRELMDTVRAAYSPETFLALADTAASVERREDLLFVVGMPRSGTTLIDQVLSAHAGAESVGESKSLEEACASVRLEPPGGRAMTRLTAQKRSREGHALRETMRALARLGEGRDAVVVDKTPFNDRRIGVLAAIAPGAKVVLTRRDPRDIALSCFYRNFAGGMEWSADMGWITEMISQRMDLHDHLLGVIPEHAPWLSITEARYEDLVAEPEGEARRLVGFMGLDWDPACLRFSERKRMLPTLDPMQTGQGVYTGSLARWKRFEPVVDGALDGLHAVAEKLGYPGA